ncbi:MAG: TetR/AcrR family transcriptional regulator [Bacilli bacterium]
MTGEKKQRRLDTDKKILAGSYIEFCKHGYSGAKISDIAAYAGVSNGLVIQNFGSKSGLYLKLIDHGAKNLTEALINKKGDLFEILNFVIDYKRNLIKSEKGYMASVFMENALNSSETPEEAIPIIMNYLRISPIYHLMEIEQEKKTIIQGSIEDLYYLFWKTMNMVILDCYRKKVDIPPNQWFIDIIKSHTES